MDASLWEELSCLSKERREEGPEQGAGGMPEGSAKRVPNFREEPKSVSIARLPSLPELKEGIDAIFSHRVRGIIEQEDSILRYGGCNSSQINAGKCLLTPNALEKYFLFFRVGGIFSFLGIMLGTDQGVVKTSQEDSKC